MLRVVTDETAGDDGRSMLDEICREGARGMLAAASEAQADVYIAELVGELDEHGHRLVTRSDDARTPDDHDRRRRGGIRAPRVGR